MAFNNEIERVKAQIFVLEKKLALLEEVEKQPRMTLQQEGEYAVVSFNDKVYYRLMGDVTFSWYIKKGVNVGYPVPTLMMVNDAETERLLEGLYCNHIQVKKVKKEKEQRTKKPVEECYKDWWGQYPETGTWDGFDEKRWQGFQAGYEFAYAISTAKEVMEKVQEEPKDNEWKSVALRFGEELVSVGPNGYYGFTAEEWFDWVVNTYEKICDDTVKLLKKENLKKAQERGERVHKKMEETIKIHDGYGGVDYKPTPQTPEQVADGLKEAFKEAVKQGVVSSTKSPTLYDVIADWWDDTFTKKETSLQELVDAIEQWLPKEQSAEGSQNAYVECTVEGFNDCLQQIKSKLR